MSRDPTDKVIIQALQTIVIKMFYRIVNMNTKVTS